MCGPDTGCNCQHCQKLDTEEFEQHQELLKIPVSSQSLLDSWVWAPQPSAEQLSSFVTSVNYEQRKLSAEAANTCLSSIRLQQRLMILKRYFIAINRAPHTSDSETITVMSKEPNAEVIEAKMKPVRAKTLQNLDPATGLARVGSRAALNFSFAFLRRAWRLGK